MPPKAQAHIGAITPYAPGKPIEEVQREFGLKEVIKLASNENPLGPSPKAKKAIAGALDEISQYPDGAGYYLKQKLAKKLKVKPEWLVLSNGSDELSDMIMTAYVPKSGNVVFSAHDFISYKLGAMMVGASFHEAPLKDWHVDPDALLSAVDKKTKLVCIANPSNPVGTYMPKKELEYFLEKLPEDVLCLLDEAYFEYVKKRDYPDSMKYVKKYPNLIVARTFSKAYGLAGMRVGYAAAHPEVIQNLDRVRPPFNVNRLALVAAEAALEDATHLKKSCEVNDKGRKSLEEGFTKMGLDFVPSVTNFILVDLQRNGAEVCQQLLQQGVIARPVAGYGLPNHVRVSIGKPLENRRFLAALKSVLFA